MNAKRAKVIALTMLLSSASGAVAQLPPNVVPNPNPSSSLVLPAPGEVPVSPTTSGKSLGSRSATGFWYGHRSFCSVFHRGPCLSRYLPPIGQDLRLTTKLLTRSRWESVKRPRSQVEQLTAKNVAYGHDSEIAA
jgi:hypothetical protein